jgi:hypothetical protein
MSCLYTIRWALGIVAMATLCVVANSVPAGAQAVTTGTLSGNVVDQQGGLLPGVTVNAVHEPTGTRYSAVTDTEGRFQIPNVVVGGPYTVTASLSGFRDERTDNVNVALGEDKTLEFKMALATVTETVTVVGQAAFSTTQAGAAASVGQAAVENLPTIARSLTDIARVSPFFNQTQSDAGDSFLSVAGTHNRYNNLQIDGAVNNDLFGLAASGTPGGQTGTQPISLDAIQELQLVVSPYDVRQGGFAGGSVNAITRSGTNQFTGTAYVFARNENLVGKGSVGRKVGQFKDQQEGFSVGGPIVRSRAFFFSNLDFGRKDTPSGYSIDGITGQNWGHLPEVQRIVDIAKTRYGYDPGSLGEFSRRNNNDKVFVRTDFNLRTGSRLTVRHNYVKGLADNGTQTQFAYYMPDYFYQIQDTTNSTVGQLNSTFGSAFNELRVTYQRERNNRGRRDGQPKFPAIQVDLPDGNNVKFGTENSSHANQLDQDIVELTDDLTLLRGGHTITIGTHNEFFKFRNLFIQNAYGNYRFASIDNFAAGIAGSYDYSFSNTGDPDQAAEFAVRQFGFYAGDQWRLRNNLTVTYGFRVDIPNFPDKPNANPVASSTFGYATDVTPAPKMFSPRAGFNWDLSGGSNNRQQIRGGVGIFSGRTPYVWLSNQYGNTGIDFTRVSISYRSSNSVAFVPDPNNQPKNVGGAATNEIDVIDPDYQYPSIVRSNLAYDRNLGFWGLIGTAEVLFSKTIKDVRYENLNLVQTGTRPDGRPLYSRLYPNLSNVLLLTNTSKGYNYSLTGKIERPFRNGWFASGSYLYNDARTIQDGTNSTAFSTWANVYTLNTSDPPLTRSNFSIGHRVTLSGSKTVPFGKGVSGTFSMYYNGQSGRPYVVLFNGDVNGDTRTTNDLLYVPANEGEVLVINGTWADLDAFISSDSSLKNRRGQVAERNGGRSPWVNTLDFRFAANVPTRTRAKVEVTMDVLNLLNLFDKNNGEVYYAAFNDILAVRYAGVDAATGKYVYDLSPLKAATFGNGFTRDDLRSRWQAQWGLRVRF